MEIFLDARFIYFWLELFILLFGLFYWNRWDSELKHITFFLLFSVLFEILGRQLAAVQIGLNNFNISNNIPEIQVQTTWLYNIYYPLEYGVLIWIYLANSDRMKKYRIIPIFLWLLFFFLFDRSLTVNIKESSIQFLYVIPVITNMILFIIVLFYLYRKSQEEIPLLSRSLALFSIGLLPYLIFASIRSIYHFFNLDSGIINFSNILLEAFKYSAIFLYLIIGYTYYKKHQTQ